MIAKLVLREICHRKVNFILAVLAVLTAVALFVAFFTTSEASLRETGKIMLDLGQNMRIIPKQTQMDRFWAQGFSQHTMPAEYIERFTRHKGFSYTHLTATLQKMISWRGKNVILTGIAPEVSPPDKPKKPMMFSVEPATVYVGFELSDSLGIKSGDEIEIMGKKFTVEKTLSQTGSSDDIRIYGELGDVQEILNLPGKINEITALECLCIIEASNGTVDPLELAKQQLAELLPEGKVLLLKDISEIRLRSRALIAGHMAMIFPVVIITCGIWVGVLAMLNVRQRVREIGLLRALGYGSGKISALFLSRAVITGIAGAIAGFFVGTYLAMHFGPEVFKITAKGLKPEYVLGLWSVGIAPVFAAIASFIPLAIAVSSDPAQTLSKE